MSADLEVKNTSRIVEKVPLKNLILKNFSRENGNFFYSIEVTPKPGLIIDFNQFSTLPLFVDITWIKSENLKAKSLFEASAFEIAREIESSQVINSVTCFNLSEDNVDDILRDCNVKNFTILRGDIVNANQKYKHANELITEIRRKTEEFLTKPTIFAGGYPETHNESKSHEDDLQNLKRKVETGVDFILTQVLFSAEKFIDFVEKGREVGIGENISIIPGLYIPLNFTELNLILKITKVSMDSKIYARFESLEDFPEDFKAFSLTFMTKIIQDIQKNSPEFIRGFHFFTMNDFEMIQKLIKIIDFSDE